jgi:ParB-like chromosome segregation protein Spo0J
MAAPHHEVGGPVGQFKSVTISGVEYNMPFADALPPLSEDAYSSLRDCIAENGIRQFIYINEYNEVIDGQHRLMIAAELNIPEEEIPFRIFSGLTEEETEEIAYGENCKRRQLSPKDLANTCFARRKDGWSLRKIAKLTGIPLSTVARHLKLAGVPDETPASSEGEDGKTYAATKPTAEELSKRKAEARKLSAEGKTHKEISETLGVSPRTVASDLSRPTETLVRGGKRFPLHRGELQAHSATDFIPDMTPREFYRLKQSIQRMGLLMPISLIKTPSGDLIIDGRQRYQACLELGIEPDFNYEHFDDPDDLFSVLSFVCSKNYFRQHFTEDQRIANEINVVEYALASGDAQMIASAKANCPEVFREVEAPYGQG